MSPLWVAIGIAVGTAVAYAASAAFRAWSRERLRAAEAEHDLAVQYGNILDTETSILRTQGVMMDAMLAQGRGAQRARQARRRKAQRKLLLR